MGRFGKQPPRALLLIDRGRTKTIDRGGTELGATDRSSRASASFRIRPVGWLNRLSNLLRRDELSRGIDEELEFHLDARTRDNVKTGMSRDAARDDARKRFGNRTLAK